MAFARCRPFLAVTFPLLRRASLAVIATLIAAGPRIAAAAEAAPYPDSAAIPGITFRWDTHRQLAPGSDNWPLTWSADGNQYTSFGDGGGFGGNEVSGRVSLGFARIEGPAAGYRGINVWGGVRGETSAKFNGKSYGIIAIGTDLYMWRCGAASAATAFDFQQLYKSTDNARTWRAANWQFPGSLTFYCPTFLQFGQGYAGARDDYAYMYAAERNSREWVAHVPGRITLMRAPKGRLMDRAAYQFFAGRDAAGEPRWSAQVGDRAPVFEDPNGSHLASAIYNPGLGRYLLTTEHAPKGEGNIGIFDAPTPWGPWTTVLYEEGWGRGQVDTSTFFANFSPKWWGRGGRDFVFAFTGSGDVDSWNTVEGSFTVGAGPARAGGTTGGGAPSRLPAAAADDTAAVRTSDRRIVDVAAVDAAATTGLDGGDGRPEAVEPMGGLGGGDAVETTAVDEREASSEETGTELSASSSGAVRAMASLDDGSASSRRGSANAGAGGTTTAPETATTAGGGTTPAGPGGTTITSAVPAAGRPAQKPQSAPAPERFEGFQNSQRSSDEEPEPEASDEVAAAEQPAAAPAATTTTAGVAAPGPTTSTEPRLVGTMARGADGSAAALVIPPDATAPVRVRAGDTVGDWSVESVAGRALTLRSGDRTLVLRLFGAASPATPAAPLTADVAG